MVVQYPHFLFTRNVSSVKDSNGNWVQSQDEPVLISICREESNQKGKVINGLDGKSIIYNSIVYLPLDCQEIQVGTEIYICEENTINSKIRVKLPVIKFANGQMNKRIWL